MSVFPDSRSSPPTLLPVKLTFRNDKRRMRRWDLLMSNFEEYFIDKYNEGIEKGIEKGRKEGILEGRQEGILEMIRNFMKSTGNSVQDTFEMFKIPETDRSN